MQGGGTVLVKIVVPALEPCEPCHHHTGHVRGPGVGDPLGLCDNRPGKFKEGISLFGAVGEVGWSAHPQGTVGGNEAVLLACLEHRACLRADGSLLRGLEPHEGVGIVHEMGVWFPLCLVGFQPGYEILAVVAHGQEILVTLDGFHRQEYVPLNRRHGPGGGVVGRVAREHGVSQWSLGPHAG